MHTRTRAAVLGVALAVATTLGHLWLLRAWAGPFPIRGAAWADSGYVLFPVLMAVVVTIAATDIGPARAGTWLAKRSLPDTPGARRHVRDWVGRTRTYRAAGFFVPVLWGNVAAWAINTSGLPPGDPVRDRLLEAAGGWPLDGWTAPIAGYAIGALVAEMRRRAPAAPAATVRRADLRPRRPAAYMQPLARWGPRVLAVAALLVAGVTAVWADPSPTIAAVAPSSAMVAIVAGLVLAATETARWLVVRHRQAGGDQDAVALDDAARSTTVHAISGSAIAIIGQPLGQHLWNLAVDWSGPLKWLAMTGGSVAPLSFGMWLGYGVGLVWVVRRGPAAAPHQPAPQP